jgi:diguanylate cyclase (GGDEF)-like protein
MKHVVLLTDAYESPATVLLDVMRAARINTLIEVLREAEFPVASEPRTVDTYTPDAVPPIAVLYEIVAGAVAEELHVAVRHMDSVWPSVPLVAVRRPLSEQESRHNPRIIDGPALKRLGFRAVADDPAQLPALLRKLDEGGKTSDLPLPSDMWKNVNDAPAPSMLPEQVAVAKLRGAFELVASLHFAGDQKSAADSAVGGFAGLVSADRWTIYLTAEASGTDSVSLEPIAVHGLTSSDRALPDIEWRRSLLGDALALAGSESQTALDAAISIETINRIENERRVLAVPLVNSEHVIGVLEAVRESESSDDFDGDDIALVNSLASPVASALANSERIAEAERLSQTDDLTKLHNARYLRHFLLNEVRRARRYNSSVTVLFLDLDDFKRVNDEHGHLVGSHVLMEMAMIILSSVRDTDVVARYGGDEFVIVLPETDLEFAARVAERVREKISGHAFSGGRRLRLGITASFGVANFPQHAQSPQQLVAFADAAMYDAKAARKNCVRFAHAVLAEDSPTDGYELKHATEAFHLPE